MDVQQKLVFDKVFERVGYSAHLTVYADKGFSLKNTDFNVVKLRVKTKSPKRCTEVEIHNPDTNRCVKRSGKIGRILRTQGLSYAKKRYFRESKH